MNIKNNGVFTKIEEFEFIIDSFRGKSTLGVGSFGEVKLARHKKS